MRKSLLTIAYFAVCATLMAQQSTIRINAQNKHQHITGFGGFVCSPQFTYNHMSTSDINKVWGTGSTIGCNIMRLYIPIGKNSWSQSLQTAKNAKSKGLIVFASPWGQPAEWKTNGTSNAKNSDGTTGKLKRENWADYAQYLEDYVQYLRTNGVELDAISIQNEPDWPAEYAGCLWSASEIAEFVKTYGRTISCKIMAPETLAISDSYANALNKSDILDCFDIYGGHQYGGIQSAYKNLGMKGKQLWMTEYLINWNEAENNTRNFDFSKDFFNFFSAINTCMLGDFNAWIHYSAKRYYGLLGDGQRGSTTGVVTKRGYIMAHFARFVTGMTRVDATISGSLEGSAYLSQTGDTVVAVLANQSEENVSATLDLPFYTTEGQQYTTGKSSNFTKKNLTFDAETCRPVVQIAANSVYTVLFVRNRDRQVSNMQGSMTRFDRLDDMSTTKSAFGTTYKLSGKTKTFDHSNWLISSRTNTTNGYIALNDRYDKLVMHVNSVTSTMNYNSSNTTLYYVNKAGQVSTHDYGTVDYSRRENFDLVFDLSPVTLPDGCIGLLGISCGNYSSVLTFKFGDVYLGSNYSGTLSGSYVADDSNVLDFSTDYSCTSIDMSLVTEVPTLLPWLSGSNKVVFVDEKSEVTGHNIVSGNTCQQLRLTTDGGDFRPSHAFTATNAELKADVPGARMLMFPFDTNVPEGVEAYTLNEDMSLQPLTSITAHTPVLVIGVGEITFRGTGEVSYATSPLNALVRGSYCQRPLYAGDYVLTRQDNQWGLKRLSSSSTLSPFEAYVHSSSTADFIALKEVSSAIRNATFIHDADHQSAYNLQGQRIGQLQGAKGIFIVGGKKIVRK